MASCSPIHSLRHSRGSLFFIPCPCRKPQIVYRFLCPGQLVSGKAQQYHGPCVSTIEAYCQRLKSSCIRIGWIRSLHYYSNFHLDFASRNYVSKKISELLFSVDGSPQIYYQGDWERLLQVVLNGSQHRRNALFAHPFVRLDDTFVTRILMMHASKSGD